MVSRMLLLLIIMAALVPLHAAAPCGSASAAADTPRDSLLVFRYEALYDSRISLERSSGAFPWNDLAAASHLNDRLALMTRVSIGGSMECFLKGAPGARAAERDFFGERFALDQAHISLRHTGLEGRLFLRERVYRSGFLLLPLVTPDRPFTSARGGGLLLEMERWDMLGLPRFDEYGGLPVFSGGADRFRHLEGRIDGLNALSVRMSASQVRSLEFGDVVTLASGLGFSALGLRLDLELARSVEGDWDDVRDGRIVELDLGRLDDGGVSAIFGEHTAVAGELDGLVFTSPRIGTFHFLPGYRYLGEGFVNPTGETARALVESYLTAWWNHPELDLCVTLRARDRYEMQENVDRRLLEGYHVGGVAPRHVPRVDLVHEIDHDPSLIISLAEESSSYRLIACARVDGTGGENDFSYLVDGSLNLTGILSVRSTLLLVRSSESFYNLGLEFRPGRRFLMHVGFGSFRPWGEEGSFQYDESIEMPEGGRFVEISTRIWFGGL